MTWVNALLLWIEVGFVLAFGLWTAIGMILFFIQTRGSLEGLLTMLDSKWKGVLILLAILFFRSIKPVLLKAKVTGPLELDMATISGTPEQYEAPTPAPEQPPAGHT